MDRQQRLAEIAAGNGLLAVYLLGSRAEDGLRVLRGETLSAEGSDLDVAVLFTDAEPPPLALAELQGPFEEVFSPLRVDLVPLHRVDPIFQFRAIDGHRIFAADSHRVDHFELDVMRAAAELLPAQRQIERDLFGTSTT